MTIKNKNSIGIGANISFFHQQRKWAAASYKYINIKINRINRKQKQARLHRLVYKTRLIGNVKRQKSFVVTYIYKWQNQQTISSKTEANEA
jgi:hypothetical protein